MAGEKSTPRTALLTMLKRSVGLSAQELAEALGVSAVAVRKHLEALEREGLVRVKVRRQRMGRPSYVYELSSEASAFFPQGYRPMLLEMLQDLAATDGELKVKRLLEAGADRQRRRYERELENLRPEERIRELARLRNEDGFMTELEEDEVSFVLKEYNCPIRDVSHRFRQACGCEVDLFRHLLGVRRVEQVETVLNGEAACTYRIPKRQD